MDLQKLFQKVNIQSQLRSIAGVFFNEDRINSTDYKPSYQRNYVWDADKASYFIESIFIGTDVPPLIYFQNDGLTEIIDGRQRYETILNFVQGKLKLKKSGLPKLGGLKDFVGKSFNDLSEEYQDLFKQTRLRIIEFQFSCDEHTKEEEEILKHEIFQRYNTGITPLKGTDVDKAEYTDDDLIQSFSQRLADEKIYEQFKDNFRFDKPNLEVYLREIRELLVANIMPVKFYARQTKTLIKHYFDFLSDKAADDNTTDEIIDSFFSKLTIIDQIRNAFEARCTGYNRLVSECLFWAFSLLEANDLDYTRYGKGDLDRLVSYLISNISHFPILRSSFADMRYLRYKCTADFFGEDNTTINFTEFLDISDAFKQYNKEVTSEKQSHMVEFKNLHINKQDATTNDVSDVCSMVSQKNYLIRPSYQRKEVISIKKASRIIESLLLNIKLPPIFVYARQDKTFEVVDGQQRLLSILGFIKRPYRNENGDEEHSKIEGFRLRLKDSILKTYDNKTFEELPVPIQRKLMSAGIWIVEINEQNNENFDPIDLFVRLNNKPYPIIADTFEMWNSYINRDIIETVKMMNVRYKSWFYLRKTRSVRMENENLLTILAYFESKVKSVPQSEWLDNGLYPDKTMDIYVAGGDISCRLKSKTEVTRFLEDDIENSIDCINRLEFGFIDNLETLLRIKSNKTDESNNAKIMDDLMCIDNGKRTIQGFYVLWLLCHDLNFNILKDRALDIYNEIKTVLLLMKKTDKVAEFISHIYDFRNRFCEPNTDDVLCTSIGKIAEIQPALRSDDVLQFSKKIEIGASRLSFATDKDDENTIILHVNRKLIEPGFVESVLASNVFFISLPKDSDTVTLSRIASFSIPYIDIKTQRLFVKLLSLIKQSGNESIERHYFQVVLDLALMEVFSPSYVHRFNIHLVEHLEVELKNDLTMEDAYQRWVSPDSEIRLNVYRVKDIANSKQ